MKFVKKYFAVLTGLLVFILYLFTVAPSVIQIDTGELATVQIIAGVAHPTGYPLFTFLGHIFSLIPLPISKIYQLNILTAIWCSAAISIFVYTCKYILDNISFFQISVKKKNNPPKRNKVKQNKTIEIKEDKNIFIVSQPASFLASILAGLMLAFSKTFWFQGTSVEVYSLHLFLISAIILSLIYSYTRNDNEYKLKYSWMVFALALAFGFSNHMTTLLILPAAAFLYFNKYGLKKEVLKGIGIMLLLFFPLLILIYIYLPLRASTSPALNWGNPVNLENILRHISGKQYQVWLFSSTAAAKKQLEYFVTNLPSEFSLTLIFAAIGIIVSFIYARKLFYFISAAFLFTVLYSINYDINDIDSYFLLANISLGFFSLFGIIQILKLIHFKKYSYLIGTAAILLFIGVEFFINLKVTDQSKTFTFQDYTKSVLSSTLPNSLILSYQWDYLISPSYYFQIVEGYRKDVTIIDKELLRRSWYYNQIKSSNKHVLAGLDNEVNMFVNALRPFERSEDFDPNLLERLYRTIITKLITENFDRMNVYIAPELVENEMQKGELVLPEGFTIVPDNLLFKVVKDKKYFASKQPDFQIRFPEYKNKYISNVERVIGDMLIRRAIYEFQNNKLENVYRYVNKIRKEYPDVRIPAELLQIVR